MELNISFHMTHFQTEGRFKNLEVEACGNIPDLKRTGKRYYRSEVKEKV